MIKRYFKGLKFYSNYRQILNFFSFTVLDSNYTKEIFHLKSFGLLSNTSSCLVWELNYKGEEYIIRGLLKPSISVSQPLRLRLRFTLLKPQPRKNIFKLHTDFSPKYLLNVSINSFYMLKNAETTSNPFTTISLYLGKITQQNFFDW